MGACDDLFNGTCLFREANVGIFKFKQRPKGEIMIFSFFSCVLAHRFGALVHPKKILKFFYKYICNELGKHPFLKHIFIFMSQLLKITRIY